MMFIRLIAAVRRRFADHLRNRKALSALRNLHDDESAGLQIQFESAASYGGPWRSR